MTYLGITLNGYATSPISTNYSARVQAGTVQTSTAQPQPQTQTQAATTAAENTSGTQNNTVQKDKDTMLLSYGIPADVIAQGDDAVRKYAQEHNINLPAKTQAPAGQGAEGQNKQQSGEEILLRYGIPAAIIAQGDDAVRKYAQEHNINLPAKGVAQTSQIQKTQTVRPVQSSQTQNSSGNYGFLGFLNSGIAVNNADNNNKAFSAAKPLSFIA